MHVFQPLPINQMEINPFNITGKTGLCVTTTAEGKVNTFASSFVSFGELWDQKVCFVFIPDNCYTKELLDQSEFFSITFFHDKYLNSIKYIQSISGKVEDKIANAGFTVNTKMHIPYIDDGNLIFLCGKLASIPIKEENIFAKHIIDKFYTDRDYHHIFVGEILEVMAR